MTCEDVEYGLAWDIIRVLLLTYPLVFWRGNHFTALVQTLVEVNVYIIIIFSITVFL